MESRGFAALCSKTFRSNWGLRRLTGGDFAKFAGLQWSVHPSEGQKKLRSY